MLKSDGVIQNCDLVKLENRIPTETNDNHLRVDNTAPTVAITGVSGTVNAAVTANFTFSEPVTGFEIGDITLSNAKVSEFSQSQTGAGAIYKATITPEDNGEFSVGVAAGVAKDAVGNDNTAAETVSATYEGPNTLPTVANGIDDQSAEVGKTTVVSLEATGSEVFTDADGDTLTYSVSTSAASTATVTVDNTAKTLTVTGVAAGEADITVTADDGKGGTASDTFKVTVTAVATPNQLPTVANGIDDQSVEVGKTTAVALEATGSEVFTDADGDTLTYSVSTSAASTATVTVDNTAKTLTVTGVAAGEADITVSADDGKGGTASDTFKVTVTGCRHTESITNRGKRDRWTRVLRWVKHSGGIGSDRQRGLHGCRRRHTDLFSLDKCSEHSHCYRDNTAKTLTVTGVAAGEADITVTADDGKGGTASDTFKVTVTAVATPNQLPTVANGIDDQSVEGG